MYAAWFGCPLLAKRADTLRFTLYYPQNAYEIGSYMGIQLDSVLGQYGFSDLEAETRIIDLVANGHTDNTGPAKKNKKLSEERARLAVRYLAENYHVRNFRYYGYGESRPIGDNMMEDGRALNLRVDIYMVYEQKVMSATGSKVKEPYRDTLLVYEDGAMVRMRRQDYDSIGHCIRYRRERRLFDVFGGLEVSDGNEQFFMLGNISLNWCTQHCFTEPLLMSLPLPDSLVNLHYGDIQAFLRKMKTNIVKLKRHRDRKWYLDVRTKCPVVFKAWSINCGRPPRMRNVRYKARDGYRIISYALSGNYYASYTRLKKPRRKVKFKARCTYGLPEVEVVAVRYKHNDTLYYASGNEKQVAHTRFCAPCNRRGIFRLGLFRRHGLRRKYIFRHPNFEQRVVLKPRKEDEGMIFSR